MGTPLKNPPVYFTVAQVRFNTLLKLADYLPELQERLRKAGYPAFTKHTAMAIEFGASDGKQVVQPVAREQFLFATADQQHAFVLASDALTLQSTNYGTFEKFSGAFLVGVHHLHETVTLAFTERVGLRYLDYVLPREGEELTGYLVPEVLGLSRRLGGQPSYAYSESLGTFGDIGLRARVVIQSGGLGFPPDLLPGSMALQSRFLERQGLHAILDTDGFVEGRKLFDLGAVGQQLHEIHKVIGAAFEATVTPTAMKAWDE